MENIVKNHFKKLQIDMIPRGWLMSNFIILIIIAQGIALASQKLIRIVCLRHKLYLHIKNGVSKYLGAPFRAKMIFRKYDLRPLFNALKHYSMRSFFNNIFQISITSKLYCWKWNFCQGGKPRSKNDHLIISEYCPILIRLKI